MKTVGAYEAKTHLPRLLEQVSKGERIIITRHGIPVAILQPPESAPLANAAEVISQLKAFRREHPLAGISIQEMIEEGRR